MFVLKKTHERLKRWYDIQSFDYLTLTGKLLSESRRTHRLEEALKEVIAQQTAKPNATVARMVKIAEEALANEESKS